MFVFSRISKNGNCLLIKKIYTIIDTDEQNVSDWSFVGCNVPRRECGKFEGGF